MMTLLIVLACVVLHTVAATATRYLIERVCKIDSYDSAPITVACAVAWPLAAIVCACAWGVRLAKTHHERNEQTDCQLRATLRDLEAQLKAARERPPSTGVHR